MPTYLVIECWIRFFNQINYISIITFYSILKCVSSISFVMDAPTIIYSILIIDNTIELCFLEEPQI